MGYPNSQQSLATQKTGEIYVALQVEADRDGARTPEEQALIDLAGEAYRINEEQDCADALSNQLRRIGPDAPNLPLGKRIVEVAAQWQQSKHTFGSDSAAKRRALVSWDENNAA